MGPPTKPLSKSWNTYNREFKEKRKQRWEEKLVKKFKQRNVDRSVEECGVINQTLRMGKSPVSTISIAVPGSIIDNAQSPELRTYLAGQIARAACIYKVDEIIVFNDKGDVPVNEDNITRKDNTLGEEGIACLQLARILQYLECPQYLRKYFFPLHKDLQYAGVLNPLDAPHHLRQQDVSLFREGVVTNKPIKSDGLYCDCNVTGGKVVVNEKR